jgi:hypothetical protein
MNDQASPEGVVAPVESEVPVAAPDGAPQEAVKPAAEEAPAATPEHDELKGVAKRIKELTESRRAAEAREERLARLLEETLRGRAAPTEKPAEPEKPKSLKDFNYDEKAYQDHLYTETRKHAEKAAKEAGERWKAEQEAVSRRAKFDERVAQFAKSVDDYSEVVTDSTPVSEGMADYLLDSDEAGAVMYYLGNNPDEARKLYHLSPAKAGAALAKLEDRLISERKKAAEKPVSKAPPPAPQVEGGTGAPGAVKVDTPDSDALSDAEWTRRRNAQEAARRRKARGD